MDNAGRGKYLMRILGIYHTFYDMLEAMELYAKEFDVSVSVDRYLKEKTIDFRDPHYDNRNNRWVINLCNVSETNKFAYLCTHPYSVVAQNYIDKKIK